MSEERIELDWVGFNENRARFTHIPSGATCLQQPYMNLKQWQDKKIEFFAQYPKDIKVISYRTKKPITVDLTPAE